MPGDIELLAGLYAFGATLAITIAHMSIIRLRITEPERERPVPDPVQRQCRRPALPVPAVIAAPSSRALAWVSVIAFHDSARWVGGGWMLFGLVGYVDLPALRRGDVADQAGAGARARR